MNLYMTTCVNRTEAPDATYYSFQGPYWALNWVVYGKTRVKRSCHLYKDGRELDINNPLDEAIINEYLRTLLKEVQVNLMQWIAEGDECARILYNPENHPYFFIYARDHLGISLN
jgi:hypothetical protein